jgi:hypothetical protein
MAHHQYRCGVCGFESHEHTTCPNCLAATLSGLPAGGVRTVPRAKRSPQLDELAAALRPLPSRDSAAQPGEE